MFGKSEQATTTGKNLWSLGDISFNGYKELSVNYPAGNYVLSYNVDTSASSTTVQVGINVDGIWKYYQVKKDNRVTIKISSNAGITAVRFCAGDSPAYNVNARYYNIQMENSTEATAYEPYTGSKPSPSVEYPQEITSCGENGIIDLKITGNNAEPQTLVLQTPNGLPGLKVDKGGNYTDENGQQWVTDEIDLARGKYVQRIGKRMFDGTEAWNTTRENTYSVSHWANDKEYGYVQNDKKYYLCSSAKIVTGDYVSIGEFSCHKNNTGSSWIIFGFAGTLEEWKQYLASKKAEGNPVTVQYILAEPVEYDLPPEIIAAFKTLHTNYPTTLVSNNADAGMELTYTVDTQSYVDKKIAEISTAIVQKGI